jgi:hypothetical protein
MQNKQLEIELKQRIEKLTNPKIDDSFFNSILYKLIPLMFSENDEILYFLLPLIERLTIEILNLYSESDIERFEQGVYRPLTTVLEKEPNKKILVCDLGEESLKEIQSLFKEKDSLREKYLKELCHVNNFDMVTNVKYLVIILLESYKRNITKEIKFDFIKSV